MKIYIPLKDILLGPGKRFDPAVNSEAEVIGFIRKAYGIISSAMDVSISDKVVCIAFKDATPARVNEALQKLSKAVGKAQDGKLSDALKLFKTSWRLSRNTWTPAVILQRYILGWAI